MASFKIGVSFFSTDDLIDLDIKEIKKLWETTKTYPLPSCVKKAEPYWEWDSHKKQQIYCNRIRCGSLVELGQIYRNAGIDVSGIPLREAIINRIRNSSIIHEMHDLCPSI